MTLLPQMKQALLDELDMSYDNKSSQEEQEKNKPKKSIDPNVITNMKINENNPTGGSKYQEMLARAKMQKKNL